MWKFALVGGVVKVRFFHTYDGQTKLLQIDMERTTDRRQKSDRHGTCVGQTKILRIDMERTDGRTKILHCQIDMQRATNRRKFFRSTCKVRMDGQTKILQIWVMAERCNQGFAFERDMCGLVVTHATFLCILPACFEGLTHCKSSGLSVLVHL